MPRKRKNLAARDKIQKRNDENSKTIYQGTRGKKLVDLSVNPAETSKISTEPENNVGSMSRDSNSPGISSEAEISQRILVDIQLNPERLIQDIEQMIDSCNSDENGLLPEINTSMLVVNETETSYEISVNNKCIIEETPDNSMDIIEDSPPSEPQVTTKTGTPSFSPEALKVLASKKISMKRIQSVTHELLTTEDNHELQVPTEIAVENVTPTTVGSDLNNGQIIPNNNEHVYKTKTSTSPSLLTTPIENLNETSMNIAIAPQSLSTPLFSPESLSNLARKARGQTDSKLPDTTHEETVPSTSRQCNDVSLEVDLNLSDDSVADPDWVNPEIDNTLRNNNNSDSDEEIEAQPKKQIKTSRWHKRRQELYDRNKQKLLRSQCLPYKDYKKRLQPAKAPKEIICKCKYLCSVNFTQEQREEICKSYWNLKDYARQKDFLITNIKESQPKRILTIAKRRRTTVRSYSLKINDETHKVCEKFFKATLCISNGPINKAFSQISETGNFGGQDRRGKHVAHNKTDPTDEDYVKKHIESYPTVQSHYCRQTSSKLYLDSELSISKMYELYKEKCQEDSKTPVSINVYRKIFCTQYNLDFHKPKKDQCLLCNKYKTMNDENSPDLEMWKKKYDLHIQLKDQSQAAKEADKKRAKEDENFNSITIDLQKVLHIPSSPVSLLYYLRKLNVYNATIYEAKEPNDGYCFIWTELDGKKGCDEVATALYLWIQRLPETVTEISIFSDTCAAQNRNQYLVSLLLFLVQKTNLQVIEHKYLESGHSHMEVDSMHSAIEHQLKNMTVFSITDLCNAIRLARSNRNAKKGSPQKKPYESILLRHTDILDVKDLANNLMQNRKIGCDGDVIQWLKVKSFRFEKTRPNIVLYRYDFTSEYKEWNVTSNNNKDRNLRKRKQIEPEKPFDYDDFVIKKAYDQKLPITKSKKKDLLKMCAEKIIPTELHPWYESLPVKDSLDYISDEDEEL